MSRRPRTPLANRHTAAATSSRPDGDRVSLKPLTYREAVRKLFAVKAPATGADAYDNDGKEAVDEDV